ncbi:MAG: ferrous iron transport protein B [Treponema sp.]|nr:ferrous iron transport protein B [Treponema sp.]
MNGEHIRIALAGNPNCGKTSLFNALTKSHHKVGNYPGVTVEKREGTCGRGGRTYHFVDLPGIYSLTAYSMDEVVSRDFILDEKPDLILNVLDATNLERNLYLCLQFQELGVPLVAALNMSDEAKAKGIVIDDAKLSALLGLPFVRTVGSKGIGIEAVLDAIDDTWENRKNKTYKEILGDKIIYGDEIEKQLEDIERTINADDVLAKKFPARWLAVKLLEEDGNALDRLRGHADGAEIISRAKIAGGRIRERYGKTAETAVSERRYGFIRETLKEAVKVNRRNEFSITESIDGIIMHRFLALPIFIGVLWLVFRLTFLLGDMPGQWLASAFRLLGEGVSLVIPAGLFRSLIVDGIITGVGSVLSFVPLIIILFTLLSILEDVGYMARSAYATDKLLHTFGLQGQSILPMMLGFGCTVPAVMAARMLKNKRDRIITVLITPLMSCGAKLPVYVLLSAALFGDNAPNMIMLVYAVGVALSLICSLVLKKTILSGDPTPFVMELPPYRIPTPKGILWHVCEKVWMYVKKAGTVIFAASIFVWAIIYFPVAQDGQPEQVQLERSIAGSIGRAIEPIFRPLGFDWKIAVASLTGFAAKEVTVSTLGVLYGVSGDPEGQGGQDLSLREAIARDKNFTPLIGFVVMIFTLIMPPCFAALTMIKMELGTKWLVFEMGFLFSIGWLIGFAVFQIGRLLGY